MRSYETDETNFHIAKCGECEKENCKMRGKFQRGMKFEGKNRCELVIKHEREEKIKENLRILQRVEFVFAYNKKIDDRNEIDREKLDINLEVQKKTILWENYDKITCFKDLINLRIVDTRKYNEDDYIAITFVMLEIEL